MATIFQNHLQKGKKHCKKGRIKLHFSEWKETTKYLDRQSNSDRNPLHNQKHG